jgi:hypothetical protein
MSSTRSFLSTVAPRAALIASIALVAGEVRAVTVEWRAPVAKLITTKPYAVVIGATVKITCTLGAKAESQIDTSTPLGKYLASERKPSWTLPVVIKVDGSEIGHWDEPGLSSPASTWKPTKSWIPAAKYAGKKVTVECIVDGDKKMLYSSQSAQLSVLAEAPPKVTLKNARGETVTEIPGGPITPSAASKAQSPDAPQLTSALADITSRPMVGVAGKPVNWGGSVSIAAIQARSRSNGYCHVAFEHFARNAGSMPTGAFKRRWHNDAAPGAATGAYPPIAAGQYLRRVDTLALAPGVNRLRLALDSMNEVQEAQENNNLFEITVKVEGDCGTAEQSVPLGQEFEKILK